MDPPTQREFPYHSSWQDLGVEPNLQGYDSARTAEEVYALAELRVLHGSRQCKAYVYKGAVGTKARTTRVYFWHELKVVFQDWHVYLAGQYDDE